MLSGFPLNPRKLCEHGLHPLRCEERAMQTLLQDLRYATRQLIWNLGLTITAVVSLALGIGATTAVFSVIYATLMNPYPYPAADRIVRLTVSSKTKSSDETNLNGPQITQLQQLHSVEAVLAL